MNRLWMLFGMLSLSALSLSVLAIAVPGALASGAQVATLKPVSGNPGARGTAQYQSQPGQRELDVEVNHLNSLAGKRVFVYVAGSKIGATRVSSSGVVELSRNAELGQRVPQVHAGTPIAVATGQAVILAGSF